MIKQQIHQVAFFKHVFPVNCYLIEEDNEITLIDAAFPFSAKKIINTAKQIGKPITKIVLTHAHDDHVGALDQLKELLPNVTVYISERDSLLLAGNKSLNNEEKGFPIRGGVPKNVKTRADLFVNDGDQIGSILAISTPGHTPGSMSFIDIRTKSLIAGDAFQTQGGVAVSGQLNWTFPFPALATWNKFAALQSARKIAELSPNSLAVGHGRMIDQPQAAIEKAIQNAEKKINSTEQGVS